MYRCCTAMRRTAVRHGKNTQKETPLPPPTRSERLHRGLHLPAHARNRRIPPRQRLKRRLCLAGGWVRRGSRARIGGRRRRAHTTTNATRYRRECQQPRHLVQPRVQAAGRRHAGGRSFCEGGGYAQELAELGKRRGERGREKGVGERVGGFILCHSLAHCFSHAPPRLLSFLSLTRSRYMLA